MVRGTSTLIILIPDNIASNSSCNVTGFPPFFKSFSKPATNLPAVVIAVGWTPSIICAKLLIKASDPSSVIEYTLEPVLVSPPLPPIIKPLGNTSDTFSKKIAEGNNFFSSIFKR